MQIEFYTKHTPISETIKDYAEKKFQRLSKILPQKFPLSAHVQLSKGRHHRTGREFQCEINICTAGKLLRAEEFGTTYEEAIDLVAEEIERQILKFKNIRRSRTGGVGSNA